MPITEHGEDWFSVAEVAEMSGLSQGTVRRRLNGGHFPAAEQVQGAWRIPRRDLEAAGFLGDAHTPSGRVDLDAQVANAREQNRILTERVAELEAELDRLRAQHPASSGNYTLDVLRALPKRIVSAVAALPPWRHRDSATRDR